jgi:hypothetical protein
MKVIKEKHPLVMRWTHWVNFPILAILIWSGMLIYRANDEYSVTLFGHTFLHFFPDRYYNLLHIPQRLAEGMAFHFLFMWFFALNGFFYVLYKIISGEWRQLLPNRHSFKEAWLVLLHDLHIRITMPPQNKYNAAQRIAYTAIIIMGSSAMHPQTLLAYQMNDELLDGKHGQPFRLIIPVKYGIKNLKRIGTISFSNRRPRDYWAEQGYDYYSGL